jgi:hypothetical protein
MVRAEILDEGEEMLTEVSQETPGPLFIRVELRFMSSRTRRSRGQPS